MKNNKLLPKTIFLLFFTSFIGFGQNIKGTILDKDSQKPLENVNVFVVKNNAIGTSSDVNGYFNLKLKPTLKKSDSIYFSFVGYTTFKTTIGNLQEDFKTIYLTKTSEVLNDVTVKQKRRKKWWLNYKKITSINSGVFSFASALVGNKLYISGGDKSRTDDPFKRAATRASEKYPEPSFWAVMDNWEPNNTYKSYNKKLYIYNLDDNSWTKSDAKLENRAYHSINLYKDNLYILGGKKITDFKKTEYLHNTIEVLNTNTFNVQIDKTNPHQAVNFASFIYQDNIIVMGGSIKVKKNGDKEFTNKIHQFNLKTGYWYEIGKMPNPKEVSGVLLNNKFYTFGGFNNQPVATIESWDVTSGKWEIEGTLFEAIEKPALTSNNGLIYIYDDGMIYIYDPTNKTLLKYLIDLNLKNAEMHFYNNTLYIVGGYKENSFSKTPSSNIYVLNILEFKKTEISNVKRF